MPDVTMCQGTTDTGSDCPKRNTCYRYKVEPSPYWQSWFVASPWFNNDCEMYWEHKPKEKKHDKS